MKRFITTLLLIAVMAMVLAACAAPPELLEFVGDYDWQALVSLAAVALFTLWPKLGVNLFGWLKDKLKLDGHKAHLMVVGFSYLLTVLAMWATNQFDLVDFDLTLTNIIAVGSSVAVGAEWTYKRLKPA